MVLLVGFAAGAVISAAIARPLRRLEATARQIAGGDLAGRASVEGTAEQRSLAVSFNEMADHLGGALEVQRRFVADASHQLRTPLTGVRLRLEAVRDATSDDAPEARDLDAGLREIDRLAALVEDLLALERADGAPAARAPVDPLAAAREAVERSRGAAAARGVRLEVAGASGEARVPPAALARTLDALVENAIAYTRAGGHVIVRAEPGLIAVEDTGPGIAADELDVVFERFHRGNAGRQDPAGSGLGLAIARRLARSWGGEVTLANLPQAGLRAVVVLTGDRSPRRVAEEVGT